YEDIEKYADGMLYGFICGDKIARGSPEAALACLVRATNHRRQCVTIGRTPGTDTPVPWVELHSAATAQLLLTHLEASGARKCAL
ncbi:hypothetical protein MJN51_35950, partial [Salmonella enterica subsp. enterica serovar Kentucky]|nr:hypothetical protein [Salmonella enterica subsp. enterica serovar Kentucky]